MRWHLEGRDENGKMDVWCEVTRWSSEERVEREIRFR